VLLLGCIFGRGVGCWRRSKGRRGGERRGRIGECRRKGCAKDSVTTEVPQSCVPVM
jgi:hypothetical protein